MSSASSLPAIDASMSKIKILILQYKLKNRQIAELIEVLKVHDTEVYHTKGKTVFIGDCPIPALSYDVSPASEAQDDVTRRIAKAWKVDFDELKEMIGKFLATSLHQECEPDVVAFLR
jgi:hypothetical protein